MLRRHYTHPDEAKNTEKVGVASLQLPHSRYIRFGITLIQLESKTLLIKLIHSDTALKDCSASSCMHPVVL